MPTARAEFGRTGHHSARVIFGGACLAAVPQRVADQTLDVLLAYGVNHLEVASSYGEAELRIRPWLRREPGRFFLATKADERTKEDARAELHRSLDRLGVDRVDLWQLHALADPIEWDIALSPGGAIEAALEARDEGLIRWIGVTGHARRLPPPTGAVSSGSTSTRCCCRTTTSRCRTPTTRPTSTRSTAPVGSGTRPFR